MLERYLQDFLHFADSSQQNSPYPWVYSYDGGEFDFHLIISAIIHGNEYGSLPGILELIQNLEQGTISFGGKMTVVLGNPEAARLNVRFLESDLNRMFLPNEYQTHEAHRARELMPIFDKADLLIDFHQTILHTQKSFYICPLTKDILHWAKILECTNAIVDATPDNTETSTTRCADDYMYLRKNPALTIELSKKGFSDTATQITRKACFNALDTITKLQSGITLSELADTKPDVHIYKTVHREPYKIRDLRLKPELFNFTPVASGEHLEAENSMEIIAPFDGYLLFPKYPKDNQPLPNEIYRIIQ